MATRRRRLRRPGPPLHRYDDPSPRPATPLRRGQQYAGHRPGAPRGPNPAPPAPRWLDDRRNPRHRAGAAHWGRAPGVGRCAAGHRPGGDPVRRLRRRRQPARRLLLHHTAPVCGHLQERRRPRPGGKGRPGGSCSAAFTPARSTPRPAGSVPACSTMFSPGPGSLRASAHLRSPERRPRPWQQILDAEPRPDRMGACSRVARENPPRGGKDAWQLLAPPWPGHSCYSSDR